MSRWFRVYDDMLNEPKVQKLSAKQFRTLINIWCVASKNGGVLPEIDCLAFQLRLDEHEVQEVVSDFLSRGLLDNDHGKLVPHNWNTRQYKSDVSSERVVKHRKKRKQQQASNVHETEMERV